MPVTAWFVQHCPFFCSIMKCIHIFTSQFAQMANTGIDIDAWIELPEITNLPKAPRARATISVFCACYLPVSRAGVILSNPLVHIFFDLRNDT